MKRVLTPRSWDLYQCLPQQDCSGTLYPIKRPLFRMCHGRRQVLYLLSRFFSCVQPWKINKVKQSRTLWSLPRPTMSSACLLSLEKKTGLIIEVRNVETKENNQRRPNKNNVVIKHSQGPLSSFSRAIDNTLSHNLCAVLQTLTLTTQWPNCTQDMSCHNPENWLQRNGNKLTLELEINCTWNNQDGTGQTTSDQFEDDCQSWLCSFCM